jgi:hypothetical protein
MARIELNEKPTIIPASLHSKRPWGSCIDPRWRLLTQSSC